MIDRRDGVVPPGRRAYTYSTRVSLAKAKLHHNYALAHALVEARVEGGRIDCQSCVRPAWASKRGTIFRVPPPAPRDRGFPSRKNRSTYGNTAVITPPA